MKLEDCTIGKLVITDDFRVGHIIGLTYNIDISLTGGMTQQEKLNRIIPLVQFPDKTSGIHHGNIEEFKG